MTKSHLKCPSCQTMFGFENTPKILKNCQHTICINCLKTLKSTHFNNSDCPIDSIQINTNKWGIRNFLTNTEILQEIQNQDALIPTKKCDRRFTFGFKQAKIPLLDFRNSQKFPQWKICNIHVQKANYVNKKDGKLICQLCIPQINLNGQNILEFDELLKFMTSFTDQTYKIFDKIKEKSETLTKSKIYESISSEIDKKKDKQMYHIKSFFQKIFQRLRKQQRLLLQKLEIQAKQSIQTLKQSFDLRESEIKNQIFRSDVSKLTTVMSCVYDYEGILKALLYLNQNSQENLLVQKGKTFLQELNQLDHKLKQKINEIGKNLQYSLDQNIIQEVQKIHSKNSKKLYSESSTQFDRTLSFYPAYSLTTFQKQVNDISSLPLQTQIGSQSMSISQNQDFLLQSMNDDIERNEGLTKNQITFQEHFSLIIPDTFQEQQFTPILRKQQDSITVNEQTTIYNNNKKCQNLPFTSSQSQQITVIKKRNRQNSLLQSFMKSETSQLEKTQIRNISRSPLTPLRNGSHSKIKKNEIPQKYLLIWQAAKQDRSINIDLTGAQLGDTIILHLAQFLSKSKKINYLKLIRNKLTDEIVFDLINCINQTNIFSLNLSQNFLTQKSLDVLENMNLGNLKSITLSQNRIVLRKVKDRIQNFKSKGITLTV